MNKLNYYHRIVVTALAYILFGLGGLVIYCLYPLITLLPIETLKKRKLGRQIIRRSFQFYIGFMKTVGIFSYETHHTEKLTGEGQLIIANHPTLIDVIFLLSIIPDTNCIVRDNLRRNPFTKGPIKTAGYIGNNEPEALIDNCATSLKKGDSLMIFPEGTRSKPNQPMKFKKGAACIALAAEKNLTPVVIQCQPIMLSKGVKWYDIPKTKPHFTITVKDDIKITDYIDDNSYVNVKYRRLTHDLLAFYNKELRGEDIGKSTQ